MSPVNSPEPPLGFHYIAVNRQTFGKGVGVPIDNMSFIECVFDGCTFIFSGGPTSFEKCKFLSQCRIEIQGTAAILWTSFARLGFEIVPPRDIYLDSIVH